MEYWSHPDPRVVALEFCKPDGPGLRAGGEDVRFSVFQFPGGVGRKPEILKSWRDGRGGGQVSSFPVSRGGGAKT